MNEFTDDSFGLIKFGKESWLKNIKEGKIWFRTIEYYQDYEADNNIGDKNEGVSDIFHPDENTKFYFSHPAIEDGKTFEISNIAGPVHSFPNYSRNTYIFCLSFFTSRDIIEKTIYDDSILTQKDWDDVFFFFNPVEFINTVRKSLDKYNPCFRKVLYFDYLKNNVNLDIFSKSEKYRYQKEVRIVFQYFGQKDRLIEQINDDTIAITLDKNIEGVIIPTDSFREGFIVENARGE
ncbi:hypothetical protein LQZ21_04965 [Treponema sp. TIM-1]|uniref:hypothetical protein n=1 Tax=Treponema sp. TIM-1 TaxID=2898417 RepID=UPI00398033EC